MTRTLPLLTLALSLLAFSPASAEPPAPDDDAAYTPVLNRDPFRSPFVEVGPLPSTDSALYPQWELSRLTLVAVLDHGGVRYALVEPPSGPAALLMEGSILGKEQARVTEISADRVTTRRVRQRVEGSILVELELRLPSSGIEFAAPAPGP